MKKAVHTSDSTMRSLFIYLEVSYHIRSILDECGILCTLVHRNLQYVHRLFQ